MQPLLCGFANISFHCANLVCDMNFVNKAAVEIESLTKRYGNRKVLDNLSMTVSEGEKVALIGPSGSGKSTILRTIASLEGIDSGSISIFGNKIVAPDALNSFGVKKNKSDKHAPQTMVGMVFQAFNLFPHLTALENCTLAPRTVLGLSNNEAIERSMALLDEVGLADKANAYPGHLSGGQQQRVAIARALALQPRVMLFDEVTASLDPELVVSVLSVIDKICTDFNLTVLMVTHQIEFISHFADRVCFFDEGHILEEGTAQQVLQDPQHERTCTFLKAIKDL